MSYEHWMVPGSAIAAAIVSLSMLASAGCGDDSGTPGGGGSGAGGSADAGGPEGGAGEGGEGGAGGEAPSGRTFVLVHGAFAGAWTWERITPALEASGDRVVTLDLPAHGDDPTKTGDATLQSYTDAVVELLDAETAPVILVGHSMGGLVVSQAAEARPDKVDKLVYLAAFLVPSDTSLLVASANDDESNLAQYLTQEGPGLVLAPEGILGAFCSDCDADDVAAIEDHLRLEPVAPFTTNITTTAANWGSVPRVYIETTADQAIGPTRQAEFYRALPCDEVISIDSGHCPFLTKPDELVAALQSL